MPDVEPTGMISLHLKHLAIALSKGANFQAFMGCSQDEAAALAAIDYHGQDTPQFPTCIVGRLHYAVDRRASGGRTTYIEKDSILSVTFEMAVSADNRAKHRNAFLTMDNWVGAIIEETQDIDQSVFAFKSWQEIHTRRSRLDEQVAADFIQSKWQVIGK